MLPGSTSLLMTVIFPPCYLKRCLETLDFCYPLGQSAASQNNRIFLLFLFPRNLGSEILAKGGDGSAGQMQLIKNPGHPHRRCSQKSRRQALATGTLRAGWCQREGPGGACRQLPEGRSPQSACAWSWVAFFSLGVGLPGRLWAMRAGGEARSTCSYCAEPREDSHFTILFLITVIYFSRLHSVSKI